MDHKGKRVRGQKSRKKSRASEGFEIHPINEKLYSDLSIEDLDKILDRSFQMGSCWTQTCPCKHLSPCECAGGREIYCDWYV
jgi:hypothetical protein